ncbi:MAG: hypothetical protein ACREJ5_14145 [Geminicoccaceae bacterium]
MMVALRHCEEPGDEAIRHPGVGLSGLLRCARNDGGEALAMTGGEALAMTGGEALALTGGEALAMTGGEALTLTGGEPLALTGGAALALTGGAALAMRGGEALAMRGGEARAMGSGTGGWWSGRGVRRRPDRFGACSGRVPARYSGSLRRIAEPATVPSFEVRGI